jgi:hypothetical protein
VVPGTAVLDARARPGSTPSPWQLHLPGILGWCTEDMTGNDLIVIAPWIIFGATLAVVLARLLRSRHRGGRW